MVCHAVILSQQKLISWRTMSLLTFWCHHLSGTLMVTIQVLTPLSRYLSVTPIVTLLECHHSSVTPIVTLLECHHSSVTPIVTT